MGTMIFVCELSTGQAISKFIPQPQDWPGLTTVSSLNMIQIHAKSQVHGLTLELAHFALLGEIIQRASVMIIAADANGAAVGRISAPNAEIIATTSAVRVGPVVLQS